MTIKITRLGTPDQLPLVPFEDIYLYRLFEVKHKYSSKSYLGIKINSKDWICFYSSNSNEDRMTRIDGYDWTSDKYENFRYCTPEETVLIKGWGN